jgi:hypothetical protein
VNFQSNIMKFILITIFLLNSSFAFTTAKKDLKIKQAEKAYNSFISILIPTHKIKHKTKFKTKGCNFDGKKLATLILFNKKMTHKFKFGKDCDLEGNYSPQMTKPFPVEFKVRNLDGFNRIKMTMQIKVLKAKEFIVEIAAIKSILLNEKSEAKFKFEYQVMLDVFSQKVNPRGGKIQLLSINGKKYKNKITVLK